MKETFKFLTIDKYFKKLTREPHSMQSHYSLQMQIFTNLQLTVPSSAVTFC